MPDSEPSGLDAFDIHELHCDNASCVPITVLLYPKAEICSVPEILKLQLSLPVISETTVEVQIPITPLDFIR